MNQPPNHATSPEEDALFAFGERVHATPADDLEATMLRVQRASGVGQGSSSTIPPDLKHQIWEDLMSTNAATITTPTQPHKTPVDVVIPRNEESSSRPRINASRWNTAANLMLAAVLIVALSAGVWRATGGFDLGFGGDSQPPTIPFGGAVVQDEGGDIDPADLPTAEDCTVEPLTVDEVIWYIQEPAIASLSVDMDTPGTYPPEVESATPPATNPPNYEPRAATQDELDEIAEVHHMWMACVLADSNFQVWALEAPWIVREQITSVLPPLTGEEDARELLEDLERDGFAGDRGSDYLFNSYSTRGFPGLGGIHVIDADPDNSWSEAEGNIAVGHSAYEEDGTYQVQGMNNSIFLANVDLERTGGGFMGKDICGVYQFVWNEARSMWLVTSAPNCG